MDVKTAFLYGAIDQLLFVETPKGYYVDYQGMVCKLNKALYGLKQSPRPWYERLSSFLLKKLGLTRINTDYSIFLTRLGLEGPIVITFVDDIKIMGPKCWKLKRYHKRCFFMPSLLSPFHLHSQLLSHFLREHSHIWIYSPISLQIILESLRE